MKKTTIIFNADCSEDSFQAQDRDAKNWAYFLNENYFEILIFAKGKPDKRIIKKNIKIIYLKHKLNWINNLKQILFLLLYPSNYIFFSKADSIERRVLDLNKLLHLKRKIVYSIVNIFPYEDKVISKSIALKSFKLFAISNKIQQNILKHYHKDSSIVHLSYDLKIFFPEEKKNNKIRVICVGSLQNRKQPFIFADAAKKIPEADFIWIGNGYYWDMIQDKIASQQISNLFLLGSLTNDKVAIELRNSDIFFFPSMHEGFPNSIVEAMASGLAIIAYHSYYPEAVLNEVNGYICENIFDMIDKIKYLILNPEVLNRFKKESRIRAKLYDGEVNIVEFEKALEN
jgi:glycosyltransferase involved in cell wall biosynthesis